MSIFLMYMPTRLISGSYADTTVNILKNWKIVFQTGYTIFTVSQQHMKGLISQH